MQARFGLWARAIISGRGVAARRGPPHPRGGCRAARARGAATFFHRGTRSQKLIVNINSRIYAYVHSATTGGTDKKTHL